MKFYLLTLLLALQPAWACAGFIVNVGSTTVAQNTPITTLAVSISGNSSGYSTGYVVADFIPSSSLTFAAVPATFQQTGQFGSGVTGSSGFEVESGVGYLSLGFDTQQAIGLGVTENLVNLHFDTSSLAPGTYLVSVDGSSVAGSASGAGFSGAGGSITITSQAVPEPTSMALLGLMTVGGVTYRKLRKAKKEPAVS